MDREKLILYLNALARSDSLIEKYRAILVDDNELYREIWQLQSEMARLIGISEELEDAIWEAKWDWDKEDKNIEEMADMILSW